MRNIGTANIIGIRLPHFIAAENSSARGCVDRRICVDKELRPVRAVLQRTGYMDGVIEFNNRGIFDHKTV